MVKYPGTPETVEGVQVGVPEIVRAAPLEDTAPFHMAAFASALEYKAPISVPSGLTREILKFFGVAFTVAEACTTTSFRPGRAVGKSSGTATAAMRSLV